MIEVNILFLFAFNLNNELQDCENNDIVAHPSCPTLKCKHCRVALVWICNNRKCQLVGPFISVNILPGHTWPEFACHGCKQPSDILSLIANCPESCFSGNDKAEIDRNKFELIQKEHMKLFSEIEPVLHFVSSKCKTFGYARVISALDKENIERVINTVFSLWFFSGSTFEACIGFFGFAKGLILHMHKQKHPLEIVAMDVLSSFMRSHVVKYMADPNDWTNAIEVFHHAQTSIEKEMKSRIKDVEKMLHSSLALKSNKDKVFNIAVVGETGSGKSSLINSLRGVSSTQRGGAKAGARETTLKRSQYAMTNNEQLIITDLPGMESVNITKELYLLIVDFPLFDFFILVSSGRIKGNDIWIAQQIRNLGKGFFFVKTKLDSDIDNEHHDNDKSATETMSELREECEMEMKNIGLYNTEIFLVSSRKADIGDFGKLKAEFESGKNMPAISARKREQALVQKDHQTKFKRQEEYIKLADILECLATSLDNQSRTMKRLRVGSASVSLVCGMGSTFCLLAAPATLGVSLIPSFILGTAGTASAAILAGSTVYERIHQKNSVAGTKALFEEIETSCVDSDEAKFESKDESNIDVAEAIEVVKGAAPLTGSTIGLILRGIKSGTATRLSNMANVADVARLGGGLLGLVGAPLDIFTIITQSLDLYNGNFSEAAKDIRKQKKWVEQKLYRSSYRRRCPNSHRCAYMY